MNKFAVSDAINQFRETLVDGLNELEEAIQEQAEAAIQPSKPQQSPQVQARIRDGVLHLQYGVPGSYKRADVTVSYLEGKRLEQLNPTEPSMAGTSTRYFRGEILSNDTLQFGGYNGVRVPSPFWSQETSPRRG